MCKVTEKENKQQDQESPSLENPHDEGPAGNVVDDDQQHGWDHPMVNGKSADVRYCFS